MKINRLLTNLCSENLADSTEFYTTLFNFKVDYNSDWFVHLISEGQELEIGIMKSNHELVPEEFRGKPTGIYITLEPLAKLQAPPRTYLLITLICI